MHTGVAWSTYSLSFVLSSKFEHILWEASGQYRRQRDFFIIALALTCSIRKIILLIFYDSWQKSAGNILNKPLANIIPYP